MRLQLAVHSYANGPVIADWSHRADELTWGQGEHGAEVLQCIVRMRPDEAWQWYTTGLGLHVAIYDAAIMPAYEGRIEDVRLLPEGLEIQVYGYWRALADLPYTALWSTTRYDVWQLLSADLTPDADSERFQLDSQDRLVLTPRKGETFTTEMGLVGYEPPSRTTRSPSTLEFTATLTAPVGWQAFAQRRSNVWGFLTSLWTLNGTGAPQTVTPSLSFSPATRLVFGLRWTGSGKARYDNVRTSLGTAVTAGSRTVAPPNMENIYVGQVLKVNGPNPEEVTPTGVTATTFTATFANAHAADAPVEGEPPVIELKITGVRTKSTTATSVTGDAIMRHLVDTITATNPTQLSASPMLIQAPGLDLRDEQYDDAWPSDVAEYLAQVGDSATPPRVWEVGVGPQQILYFRPRGSGGRAWYIDVSDTLDVQRSLVETWTSAYALSRSANGRTLRGLTTTDATATNRTRFTRRTAVTTQATTFAQADVQRDAFLGDHLDPLPRATISVRAVFDRWGSPWPRTVVRPGDTITIRNLPAAMGQAIDRLRTFRVGTVRYTAKDNTLEITPEAPRPTLETLLTRQAEGY